VQGALRTATWTSSNPSVARVTRDGVVQATGQGRAFIRVRSGASSDSVAFDVEPTAVATNTTPPPVKAQETPPTEVKPPVTPPVVATNPPVSTSSSAASDAEAKEAAMKTQVGAVVANYARALESSQLANVLKVFPSMDRRTQDGWKLLFESVRELDVNMRVAGPISINGNGGTARVSGEYLYVNPSNRRRCRQEVMLIMEFDKLDTGAGQIVGSRQESSNMSGC
jgi:hypothetical protein